MVNIWYPKTELSTNLLSLALVILTSFKLSFACPFTSTEACALCIYENDLQKGWTINCDGRVNSFPNIVNGTKIFKLSLTHNNISTIPLLAFSNVTVTELYLSTNDIFSTKFLQQKSLQSLRVLDISNNFDLSSSGVRAVHFQFLENLQILRITETSIKDLDFLIDVANIDHLSGLQKLDVSFNDLNEPTCIANETFDGKTNLKNLEAVGCGIGNLEFLRSSSLLNLERLYLSRNSITSIKRKDVKYLTSLSILHINNNEIATLDARVLNNLPSLTILEWRNNDPTCDCDISWLKDWMQDNPNVTIDYDTKVLDNCEAFYNSSICTMETTWPYFYSSTSSSTMDDTFSYESSQSTETTKAAPPPTRARTPNVQTTSADPPSPPSQTTIIIVVAVSAGVIITVLVVILVVCLVKRRSNRNELTTPNMRPSIKEDEYYTGGHYYSEPDQRPKSMEGRLLPLPPGSSRNTSIVYQDPNGYLKPEFLARADVADYSNSRENTDGYLQPINEELRKQAKKEQVSIDEAYIDIQKAHNDGGHYESLKIRENNSSDNQPTYMTLGNHEETNAEYEVMRSSVRGVSNIGYK